MTWWVPGDEALAPAQNLELARFLKQLPKTHSPLCPARNPLLLTWLTGGSRRGELGLPRAQHGGAQAGWRSALAVSTLQSSQQGPTHGKGPIKVSSSYYYVQGLGSEALLFLTIRSFCLKRPEGQGGACLRSFSWAGDSPGVHSSPRSRSCFFSF